MRQRALSLSALAMATLLPAAASAGELTVVAVAPVPRTVGVPADSAISVTFDRAIEPTSLVANRSFWAFGRWSGTASGSFVLSQADETVTLVPDRPFSAGESVMVILSDQLQAADGSPFRSGGYSFQFWVESAPATRQFEEVDQLSTRTTPGESSRAYGGLASDLDGDGAPDLTVVNEDTADLRVFLNRADGSGTYEPFLQPTFPTGAVPSPSEPADFDGDGRADVAVANVGGGSVSVLLGNGDGTFGPHQEIALGGSPRGIAVLDLDGDGDLDVAATNASASSLALLINNGSGVFGSPQTVGNGNGDEWALAAADMNEDGLLDLVVGGQNSQTAWVYAGQGDGTVSEISSQPAGGLAWQLAMGDLDGDGHEDAAFGNGTSNNGTILLGDGGGHLGSPQAYAADPLVVATDLGDLDGDGDLDWVTSSFSGDFAVRLNDGSGAFTFDQEIAAPQAASCATLVDMDGDGDLDMALIDELADLVLLEHNAGGIFLDGFESGDTSAWSLAVP